LNTRAAKLIGLVVVTLALGACGKKADPFLPKNELSLVVQQLKAERADGAVTLQGRIPEGTPAEQEAKRVIGIRLYHTRYKVQAAPCDACPIDFPGYREVKDPVLRGNLFSHTVDKRPKRGIHFFQVRFMGEEGALGPPSNVAKLAVTD
jgi:hypothetical protein